MKYVFMLALLGLVACGSDRRVDYVYTDRIVTAKQEFEGVYYFANGGFLEIVVNSDGKASDQRTPSYDGISIIISSIAINRQNDLKLSAFKHRNLYIRPSTIPNVSS